MQVTLRMATEQSTPDDCRRVFQKRWQAAQQHIPEDKRGRMKGMIEEKFHITLAAVTDQDLLASTSFEFTM